MTIKVSDPKYKEFIEPINKKDYHILVGKLPLGESIMCSDDKDMLVIKGEDGSIVLNKKCHSQTCFIR